MDEKVRQLHEMINASIFGWPNTEEVKKAHELLDEIVGRSVPTRMRDQLVRLNGTDNPEPVDPWEEWIWQFPQVLDQQAIEMVQDWLRTCPRGK